MRVKDYLEQVADIVPSEIPDDDAMIYVSKFDGSYLTRVGTEDSVKFLADREITEELTHGTGFSPKDGKWYGWSHRAIYGFKPGSTCKKGDCHYFASCIDDELEAAIAFWSGENHINVTARAVKEGVILVEWEYDDETPNKKIRGTITSVEWHYGQKFGRGEWTAETMEDARQMAIDFNEGVS